MAAAPTPDDLDGLLGGTPGEIDVAKATAVLAIVSAMVASYTRGRGFTDGGPSSDVRAVILTASARLYCDPTQIFAEEVMGPFSMSYRAAFDGWSVAELAVLNRYRARAM